MGLVIMKLDVEFIITIVNNVIIFWIFTSVGSGGFLLGAKWLDDWSKLQHSPQYLSITNNLPFLVILNLFWFSFVIILFVELFVILSRSPSLPNHVYSRNHSELIYYFIYVPTVRREKDVKILYCVNFSSSMSLHWKLCFFLYLGSNTDHWNQ